jgi:hypothetical protein
MNGRSKTYWLAHIAGKIRRIHDCIAKASAGHG